MWCPECYLRVLYCYYYDRAMAVVQWVLPAGVILLLLWPGYACGAVSVTCGCDTVIIMAWLCKWCPECYLRVLYCYYYDPAMHVVPRMLPAGVILLLLWPGYAFGAQSVTWGCYTVIIMTGLCMWCPECYLRVLYCDYYGRAMHVVPRVLPEGVILLLLSEFID